MKIKVIFLSLMSLAVVGNVSAQIEQDDMYFNSKDRAKLREAEKANALAIASTRKTEREEDESNPTDSYSARNVNPEFVSRQNSKSTQADESEYYVSNYQSGQRYYNNWNNNYNRWYNNAWYSNNYWGPSIMSWNSPYYGSYYDSWGNPWNNPYYQSAFSTSFSYYYGNNWNYGWGMNSCYSCGSYGYYDPFYANYNPYYGYNSYYSNNYWNSPYRYYNSWGGGYNPYRVVYINHDNDYRASYGKRNSRSSQLSRDFNGSTRSNGRLAEDINRDRTNSGGRSRDTYYDNSWRNTNRTNTNSQQRTVDWNNTNSNSRSTDSNSNTRSSWESQQRSNTTSTPSRSVDSGRSTSSPASGGNSSGSGSRSSRRGN